MEREWHTGTSYDVDAFAFLGIFPAVVEGPEWGSPDYSEEVSQLGSTRVHVQNKINSFNSLKMFPSNEKELY